MLSRCNVFSPPTSLSGAMLKQLSFFIHLFIFFPQIIQVYSFFFFFCMCTKGYGSYHLIHTFKSRTVELAGTSRTEFFPTENIYSSAPIPVIIHCQRTRQVSKWKLKLESCSHFETWITLTFSVNCLYFETGFHFNFLHILQQNELCNGKNKIKVKHLTNFSLWKTAFLFEGRGSWK